MKIDELLNLMINRRASELYLMIPSPPLLRIAGSLLPQEDLPAVTTEDVEMVLEDITTPEQRNVLYQDTELDLAINIPQLAQFQVSALYQRGAVSLALGLVPFEVLSNAELETLLGPSGLILVTSARSTGKSTAIAGMVVNLN